MDDKRGKVYFVPPTTHKHVLANLLYIIQSYNSPLWWVFSMIHGMHSSTKIEIAEIFPVLQDVVSCSP